MCVDICRFLSVTLKLNKGNRCPQRTSLHLDLDLRLHTIQLVLKSLKYICFYVGTTGGIGFTLRWGLLLSHIRLEDIYMSSLLQ
jgi:hypothetical protein